MRENPKRAEQLIARLGELLRQSLTEDTRAEVSLAEEIDLLQRYLEIQEARFGERLVTRVTPDANTLELKVPKLILQPLVENAIRHGLAPRASAGTIRIFSHVDGGDLRILVEDDGVGMSAGQNGKAGLGLSITRARLQQFAGSAASLSVAPSAVVVSITAGTDSATGSVSLLADTGSASAISAIPAAQVQLVLTSPIGS